MLSQRILLRIGIHLSRRNIRRIRQRPVPQNRARKTTRRRSRQHARIIIPVRRAEIRLRRHPKQMPNLLIITGQLLNNLLIRQARQRRMTIRMVRNLQLTALHQRQQQVTMLPKRRVLTVDKEGEARAGTARKLRVGAYHLRVGAVIDRPRNILALTGQAGLRAGPGTSFGNRVRRGRSRRSGLRCRSGRGWGTRCGARCGRGSRRACRRGRRRARRGATRRTTGRGVRRGTARGRPTSRYLVSVIRRGRGATGEAKTQHAEAHRAQTKGTNVL